MKKERIAKFKCVKEPEYVWYSDVPLTPDKVTERKISIKALEEMVGDGFKYSENVYCDTGFKHNFALTKQTKVVINKILRRVNTPLIDKLVICYMGPEVGFGVFARDKINMGDVVAIYNGVMSKRDNEKTTGYNFDIGDEEISDFDINAASIGGISRFFQHLPYNPNHIADQLIKLFKQNTSLIKTYLEISGEWNELTPDEQKISMENLTYDILHGDCQYFKGMMSYELTEKVIFEIKNIEFKARTTITYANLRMCKLVLNPRNPILYLYAEYNITRGIQLGFSYGIGYWSNIGRLPLLFEKNGKMISQEMYKYKKVLVAPRLPGRKLKAFPFTREEYLRSLGKNEAIVLANLNCPVSFFSVRKFLVRNNVISQKHLPKQHSEFAAHLRKRLPEDIVIETFDRYPDADKEDNQCVYDLVCKTNSFQRWAQLTVYLRHNETIGGFCKSLRFTGEVIILRANEHPAKLYKFIKSNSVAVAQKYFATEIPKEELPENPGYEDNSRIFPHF